MPPSRAESRKRLVYAENAHDSKRRWNDWPRVAKQRMKSERPPNALPNSSLLMLELQNLIEGLINLASIVCTQGLFEGHELGVEVGQRFT